MIKDTNRAGWFGASDTAMVMGNWGTPSFKRWWLMKLGIAENSYTNRYMQAGRHWEHRILDYLGIAKRDRQIKMRSLRLRVNLDGEDASIHEVKTHKGQYKLTKAHWQQAQVQAFAARKPVVIEAYQLCEEDYANYFSDIDPARLSHHDVPYDAVWIRGEYLPRLAHLAKCLKGGRLPDAWKNA